MKKISEQERSSLPQMFRQRNNPLNTMNNQAKMEAQKENERFPETRPNVMEDCNLNIREFLRLLLYNDINQCYPPIH